MIWFTNFGLALHRFLWFILIYLTVPSSIHTHFTRRSQSHNTANNSARKTRANIKIRLIADPEACCVARIIEIAGPKGLFQQIIRGKPLLLFRKNICAFSIPTKLYHTTISFEASLELLQPI